MESRLGMADEVNPVAIIPYPDISGQVLENTSDVSGRKPVLVVCDGDVLEFYVFRIHESDVPQVEYAYPADVAGNPKPVVLHFLYVVNVVGYQGIRISRFVSEYLEVFCYRIEKSQSLVGSYPNVFKMVDADAIYTASRQAFGIMWVILIMFQTVAFQVDDAHAFRGVSHV